MTEKNEIDFRVLNQQTQEYIYFDENIPYEEFYEYIRSSFPREEGVNFEVEICLEGESSVAVFEEWNEERHNTLMQKIKDIKLFAYSNKLDNVLLASLFREFFIWYERKASGFIHLPMKAFEGLETDEVFFFPREVVNHIISIEIMNGIKERKIKDSEDIKDLLDKYSNEYDELPDDSPYVLWDHPCGYSYFRFFPELINDFDII